MYSKLQQCTFAFSQNDDHLSKFQEVTEKTSLLYLATGTLDSTPSTWGIVARQIVQSVSVCCSYQDDSDDDDAKKLRPDSNSTQSLVESNTSQRLGSSYQKPEESDPTYQQDSSAQGPQEIFRQPERLISQAQLVAEVKGIYAGFVIVERECAKVVKKHLAALARKVPPGTQVMLSNEQWRALITLHETLLHELYDFFLASQHPSAPLTVRNLIVKYAVAARLGRHILSFLKLLYNHLPDSRNHMIAFIYLAHGLVAAISEAVPAFVKTWNKYLGELNRYRISIEDDGIQDLEYWTQVSSAAELTNIMRHPPDAKSPADTESIIGVRSSDTKSAADTKIVMPGQPTPSGTKSAAYIENIIGDPSSDTGSGADTDTTMGDPPDAESAAGTKSSIWDPSPDAGSGADTDVIMGDLSDAESAADTESSIGDPSLDAENVADTEIIMGGLPTLSDAKSTPSIETITGSAESMIRFSTLPAEQMDGYNIVEFFVDQQPKEGYARVSEFISQGVHFFALGYTTDSQLIFEIACKLCKDGLWNKCGEGLEPALIAVEHIYQTFKLPSTLSDRLCFILSFFQRDGDPIIEAKPYRDCPNPANFPLRCPFCDKETPAYRNILVHVWICHHDDFPKDFSEFSSFANRKFDEALDVRKRWFLNRLHRLHSTILERQNNAPIWKVKWDYSGWEYQDWSRSIPNRDNFENFAEGSIAKLHDFKNLALSSTAYLGDFINWGKGAALGNKSSASRVS